MTNQHVRINKISRRIILGLILAIILLSSFTIQQVAAHYTLGFQSPNGPAPPRGDGVNTDWNAVDDNLRGGHVLDPYALTNGYGTASIAYVSPGLLYQPLDVQANYYSPNGSILTDTVGPLYFYINISDPANLSDPNQPGLDISWEKHSARARWLYIAIPPEFTPVADTPSKWKVVTSITSDYHFIKTGKLANDHPLAPGWNYIAITAANVTDPTTGKSANYLYPAGEDPFKDRQPWKKPDWRWGTYEIVAFDMKAPSCAGKYFFKVFYTKTLLYDIYEQYESFPPENYPQLVVKGEVDPGYITGTVRYAGHSSYYYGNYYGDGVYSPGYVFANGTALDPVTNQPTGRSVCGWGWFNATAEGYYEIEGLAPGVYTLTACAAGFVPRTLPTQITLKRGQSLHGIDIYIQPTCKFNLTIYSKCPTGPVDWPHYTTFGTPTTPLGEVGKKLATLYPPNPEPLLGYPYAYYYIEIYDAEDNRITWIDGFFDITQANAQQIPAFSAFFGNPICYSGVEVGWDGHVPDANAHFTCGLVPGDYRIKAWVFGYVQAKEYMISCPGVEFPGQSSIEMDLFKGGVINATVHWHDQELPSAEVPPTTSGALIFEAVDANGVVQAFNFTDFKSAPTSSAQSLMLIGVGPSPKKWKEPPHGMPEGTYTIKAYYPGYVQQEFPQHTVQYCTNGSLSFHLIKGAIIDTTVFSRDCEDPSQPVNWVHPPAQLRVYVFDEKANWIAGGYFDRKRQKEGTDTVKFSGLTGLEFSTSDYLRDKNAPTGLATGKYKLLAYTVGYYQTQDVEVWAQKGTSTGDIPIYLLVGAEIRVVIDFKTELVPAPLPDDVWSYQFRIEAYDPDGNIIAANITGVPQTSTNTVSQWPWPGPLNPAQPQGVQTWVFQLFGFGEFTSPENQLVGPNLGTWLNPGNPESAMDTALSNWYKKRFGYYFPFYGSPKGAPTEYGNGERYSGHKRSYGIPPGTYTIIAYVWNPEYPGRYVQLSTVTTTPPCKGISTVVFEMDLLGRISGFAYTRNYMGDFRAGSWLTSTIEGSTATYRSYTYDGIYWAYVQPDTYVNTMALIPPGTGAGYTEQSKTAVVTWGGQTDGQNFYLEESGIPIPEFPLVGMLAAISAIGAAILLLKRQNRQIPLMIGH
jgi:hypothetical protein